MRKLVGSLLFSVLAVFFSQRVVLAKEAEKVFEEFSSTNRVGCAAELGGFHFNLKELSMPLNE